MTSSSQQQQGDYIDIFKECVANTAKICTDPIDNNDESSASSPSSLLFASDKERKVCRKLVEALPENLQLHAANTSYAYWYLVANGHDDNTATTSSITEQDQLYAAMREARRHYVYCNRDFDKTLTHLKEACEFRMVRTESYLLSSKFSKIRFLILSPPLFRIRRSICYVHVLILLMFT